MVRPTLVWLSLVLATLGSYSLAEYGSVRTLAVPIIMAIAAIKIRLIVRHFMELRHGPTPWRLYFDAWIGVCASVIAGFFLFAVA